MGECPPSGVLAYDEGDRSTLTVELWDRDDPERGDEPRVNVTAEDHERNYVATAGLRVDQVRELRDSLTRWLKVASDEEER